MSQNVVCREAVAECANVLLRPHVADLHSPGDVEVRKLHSDADVRGLVAPGFGVEDERSDPSLPDGLRPDLNGLVGAEPGDRLVTRVAIPNLVDLEKAGGIIRERLIIGRQEQSVPGWPPCW